MQSELQLTVLALVISVLVGSDACNPTNSDETKGSIPHSTGDTTVPPPGVADGSVAAPPTRTLDTPTADGSFGGAARMQLHESTLYGKDSVLGSLNVTDAAAYFQDGNKRIRLIQDNPMTAKDANELMADAARALRALGGQFVWAKGELQGDIIWGAEVKAVAH